MFLAGLGLFVGSCVIIALSTGAAGVVGAVVNHQRDLGASASDALATGLSRAALLMAIWTAAGIALVAFGARRRARHAKAIDRAAAAAATSHTIPTRPVAGS